MSGNGELLKQHAAPPDTPVRRLEVALAWVALTEKEARYAHHFSKASWAGARACLQQVSPESPAIFGLLLGLFKTGFSQLPPSTSADSLFGFAAAAKRVVEEADWRAFLAYAATFFANMGNYLGFGDSKIVPALPQAKFEAIVNACPALGDARVALREQWARVRDKIYSLEPGERELGWPPRGISGYYSPDISKEEADAVGAWMQAQGIEPHNTRLFRRQRAPDNPGAAGASAGGSTQAPTDGKPGYELRVAAAQGAAQTFDAKDFSVAVVYGDYLVEMAEVADELEKALPYAANDTQASMLRAYIEHFRTGNMAAHRRSQSLWIADRGPVVETNIGFIETYRDPLGVRAEFEGLVAIVNKEMSAKFGALVDAAPRLLAALPYPREFEKDTFQRPDFTSLEVLAFAGTGVPAGINIPNYDDIRQNEGFKNVSLGNVLAAPEGAEPVTFLADSEQELYRRLKAPAFEVQVGLHELLGHGSGKLLRREADGSANFDARSLTDPLTGQPVASWYGPGETWDSKFGAISGAYEECRAECTAIFLALEPEALAIFGHSGSAADDILYICWLNMARAGLVGLEMYSTDTGAWRQAHARARYAILRIMLAAAAADTSPGPPLVELRRVEHQEENGASVPDVEVHLNRAKIGSVGGPAIRDFLARLNIYKATANVDAGTAMFQQASEVSPEFLELRSIVLARKKPRPLFVQPHTALDAAAPHGVRLEQFEPSQEGIILSFVSRY